VESQLQLVRRNLNSSDFSYNIKTKQILDYVDSQLELVRWYRWYRRFIGAEHLSRIEVYLVAAYRFS
jgi:hypothetical protein